MRRLAGGGLLAGLVMVLEGATDDLDFGAFADAVVEIYDIAGAHADAAVGCGGAEAPDFWGAVDVDVAAECVAIFWLAAFEPEDAADDGVAAGGVGAEDFAGGAAVFEDGTGGQAIADFLGDGHFPEGCAV